MVVCSKSPGSQAREGRWWLAVGHGPVPLSAGCLVALMVASLFCVGAPRANAQAPQQVTFGLEGCRITAGITLPINGQFVCPDNLYTSGSLGPNWSELDLVPYRLDADNRGPAQTYTVAVAGDFEDGGVRGFDVVSVPVLNQGLSDSTCQAAAVGPQTVRQPGVGGADASVYRNLTITQAAGEYCVYDYTLRLALGAADFPGASLSGRFGSENFAGSNQNVGIQTSALDPQQLSKTIEAARGNGFLWTVNKSSIPSQLSVDTCLDNPAATLPEHDHLDPNTGYRGRHLDLDRAGDQPVEPGPVHPGHRCRQCRRGSSRHDDREPSPAARRRGELPGAHSTRYGTCQHDDDFGHGDRHLHRHGDRPADPSAHDGHRFGTCPRQPARQRHGEDHRRHDQHWRPHLRRRDSVRRPIPAP